MSVKLPTGQKSQQLVVHKEIEILCRNVWHKQNNKIQQQPDNNSRRLEFPCARAH